MQLLMIVLKRSIDIQQAKLLKLFLHMVVQLIRQQVILKFLINTIKKQQIQSIVNVYQITERIELNKHLLYYVENGIMKLSY